MSPGSAPSKLLEEGKGREPLGEGARKGLVRTVPRSGKGGGGQWAGPEGTAGLGEARSRRRKPSAHQARGRVSLGVSAHLPQVVREQELGRQEDAVFVAHFHLTFPFDVRTWGREGAVSVPPSPAVGPKHGLPSQPSSLPVACSEHSFPRALQRRRPSPPPSPAPSTCPGSTAGSASLVLSCCFPQAAANETLSSEDSSAGTEPGASPPLPWQQDLLREAHGQGVGTAALRGRRQQPQEREPREQPPALRHPDPETRGGTAALLPTRRPRAELGLADPPRLLGSTPGSAQSRPPVLAKRRRRSRGSRGSFGRESSVIGELQREVGLGGEGEEEAELQGRDSDEEKGKNNNKTKPKQTSVGLLLAETRSMYWQSAWSRSRSKLGRWGTGLELSCLRPASSRHCPALVPPMDPQIRDGEHKVPQAPVQGSPSASLPWGLPGGQARRVSPARDPSLAEGSPSLPEPLRSPGWVWGAGWGPGNPGRAACVRGSCLGPWWAGKPRTWGAHGSGPRAPLRGERRHPQSPRQGNTCCPSALCRRSEG